MVSVIVVRSIFVLVIVVFVAITTTTVTLLIAYGTQQHCSIDPIVQIPWLLDSKSRNDYHNTSGDDMLMIQQESSILSIATCDVFSDTYDSARQKFRAAVQALQPNSYRLVSIPISNTSVNDVDDSTIDIVVIPGNCDDDDGDDDDDGNGIVIHISGTHGIEGFAGSAIQIGFLHGFAQQQQNYSDQNTNVTTVFTCHSTIVFIHAFNPYGMKHFRRVNEHNVDLNRNGLVTEEEWDRVLNQQHYNTQNYDMLVAQHLLSTSTTPDSWYSWIFKYCGSIDNVWMERYVHSWTRMTLALIRFGIPTLKAALVGGQYHVPDGLFYGGGSRGNIENGQAAKHVERNEPSLVLVREWLDNFLLERRRSRRSFRNEEILEVSDHDVDEIDGECVTWIDVHTGLGPMGIDTLLFGSSKLPPDPTHLKHWFPMSFVASSSTIQNPAKDSNMDSTATTADAVQQGYERVVGYTMDYYHTTLFDKHYNNRYNLFMVQEFGTVPSVLTGRALIVEHLIHNHYSPNTTVRSTNTTELLMQTSKEVLGAAFYPQRTEWRINILQRGMYAVQQAMRRSSHYSRRHRRSQADSVQNGESITSTSEESISTHSNKVDESIKSEL